MPFVKMAFLLIFHIHFCAHCTKSWYFFLFSPFYFWYALYFFVFFSTFFRIFDFRQAVTQLNLNRYVFAPFYHI